MSSNPASPAPAPPSSAGRPSRRAAGLAALGGLALLCCALAGCGLLLWLAGSFLAPGATPTAPGAASKLLTPTVRPSLTPLAGQIYNLTKYAPSTTPASTRVRFWTLTPTPITILTSISRSTDQAVATLTAYVCLAAYPDFCISPLKRLGCPNLPARNFTVLPPDPYGYDPDGDGIGCEP